MIAVAARAMRRHAWLGRLLAASWGQVAAALVSLVGLRFYTARMTPSVFGEAMLALGALTFIDGVFGMAYNQTLTVLLKDHEAHAARLALGLGLGALFGRLMLAVTAVLGLVAGGGALFGWSTPLLAPVLIAALVYALGEPVRITGQVIVLIERRYMMLSSWMAVDALMSLAATLLYLRATAPSAASLCIGLVAGRMLATILFWSVVFGPRALALADLAAARAARRRALEFALPVSAMAPLGWLSLYIDRYVVGLITGPASAGLLAALTGAVTRPYSIVSAALTNYYRPDLLDRAAGRGTAQSHPLREWLLVAAVGGSIGMLLMAVFGRIITAFLISFRSGAEHGPALLVLIALSQVLVLLTHAVDNHVLAIGRSRSLLVQQSFAVLLGLPMILAGALFDGVVGAAWGRVVNELVKLCFAGWLALASRVTRGAAADAPGEALIEL